MLGSTRVGESLEVPQQSVPVGSLLCCDLNFRLLLELPCTLVAHENSAGSQTPARLSEGGREEELLEYQTMKLR